MCFVKTFIFCSGHQSKVKWRKKSRQQQQSEHIFLNTTQVSHICLSKLHSRGQLFLFFITYTNFMVWNLQSTTNLHVCQRCMYFLCFSLSCYMYIVYTVYFFSKRMMIPRKSVIIFNLVKIHEDIFWLIGFLDFSETQT